MRLERIVEAIHRLKEIKRTGWLERGVKDPETVASHSYGVALLTLLIAHQRGLDTLNAVATALLHDLAEALTGDLTPEMKNTKGREEAERTEQTMLKKLIIDLPEQEKKWLNKLIEEYYQQSTPEARLIKQIDKADMILQAIHYINTENLRKTDAAELINSSLNEIRDTEIKEIIKQCFVSGENLNC